MLKLLKWFFIVVTLLVVLIFSLLYFFGTGQLGNFEATPSPVGKALPSELVQQRYQNQMDSSGVMGFKQDKQILFGDLHVHTTYSFDAFTLSLPDTEGNIGSHPPADACDYARYCSAVDFWSINDHAEQITPRIWDETVEAIRECNAVVDDSTNPDTVAFLGWEWTQTGPTPETHFGHKNIILRGLSDDDIPQRPIAAPVQGMPIPPTIARGALALAANNQRTHDLMAYATDLANTPWCEPGGSVREREESCIEIADNPNVLFDKLDQWGVESMVIPHGTTWGIYSPPGTDWRKQLATYHDPKQQTLIEIMSGHGNSERFIDNQAYGVDPAGNLFCPTETASYLPGCRQAGRIIYQRCLDAGETTQLCEERAAEARQNFVDAGKAGHLTVPGADLWTAWLDSAQCRDCFLPAFNYRRRGSAQYMLAMTDFSDPENPARFNFGFIGASDNHGARPGTGYKEINLKKNTDINGLIPIIDALGANSDKPLAQSQKLAWEDADPQMLAEAQRFNSFWYTGGLVAIHVPARDRDSVWEALQRKEVYATSGPRIKLWFDLLTDAGTVPMGSTITSNHNPRLRVRAQGSFEQKPGCPDYATTALGTEKLESLCSNECYNPSDQLRPITRLEVVRIRPQQYPDEPLDSLIDDPWKIVNCPENNKGCEAIFEDEEYNPNARDSIYYARAIEIASPTMNAGNLGCEYDENGVCIEMRDCGNAAVRGTLADDMTSDDSLNADCLAPAEHRAWSSPIFVNAL